MSRSGWIGTIILLVLLAVTVTWTYLSTVMELPAIGLGLKVEKNVLFGILIGLAVLLSIIMVSSSKKGKGRSC